MALGIYQVTYSGRKFCWSVGSRFASLGTSRSARTMKFGRPYQGPDQIELEIVVYLIQPSGGGGRVGGTVNSEKFEKMRYFQLTNG